MNSSEKGKDRLSVGDATKLLAEVDATDREAARLAVNKAVASAQEQWISAELIAEALVMELMTIAQNNLSTKGVASYLRQLATHVEAHSDMH